MSYTDNSLLLNERVVHRTRLSKVVFVMPAIVLGIGLLLLIPALAGMPAGYGIAALFIVPGLIAGAARYMAFATSEFAITNKRVIIKVGFLRRHTLEMQLSKLEAIAVSQGIVGRLFGYGNIVVTGTGGTKEPFRTISGPLEFRRAAQAAII